MVPLKKSEYAKVSKESLNFRPDKVIRWSLRTRTLEGDRLRFSDTLSLSSVALVASTEDGEETRPSLIEADGHQSSRRYENQSWRSLGAQEDRLQLLHPSDCLHTSFLISPSFLSSRLRCSTLASFFFFLAGFTNGLVTMEIAARETLTYSG